MKLFVCFTDLLHPKLLLSPRFLFPLFNLSTILPDLLYSACPPLHSGKVGNAAVEKSEIPFVPFFIAIPPIALPPRGPLKKPHGRVQQPPQPFLGRVPSRGVWVWVLCFPRRPKRHERFSLTWPVLFLSQ